MLQDGQEILEGRFQIIKKLGSGAFGEIYKGKHDKDLASSDSSDSIPDQMGLLSVFVLNQMSIYL